MEERTVWVVTTNNDLTEGRGSQYIKAVCELESTARRLAKGSYIQGSDCPITTKKMFRHNGEWYAPAVITRPNEADILAEKVLVAKREAEEKRKAALNRARELGLSDEDIELLGKPL